MFADEFPVNLTTRSESGNLTEIKMFKKAFKMPICFEKKFSEFIMLDFIIRFHFLVFWSITVPKLELFVLPLFSSKF